MADQRLDTAEALRQREDFKTTDHLIYIGEDALKLKRDHAAKALHLPLCECMIGMSRQTWIIHLLHSRMFRQETGHSVRVLFMLAHAYR